MPDLIEQQLTYAAAFKPEATIFENMNRNLPNYGFYPPPPQGNFLHGFEDSFLSRDVLGDFKPASTSLYATEMHSMHSPPRPQMFGFGGPFAGDSLLEQMPSSISGLPHPPHSETDAQQSAQMTAVSHNQFMPRFPNVYSPAYTHPPPAFTTNIPLASPLGNPSMQLQPQDFDPRDLEIFAERFKQRRIKLGVTQADVGTALANLQLPGVGALSQSTICRFESLTLSHNNMVALKPILETWLDNAEKEQRDRSSLLADDDGDKRRKRTSIAAPEKRSLEAYFAVQPRPSGEKIAQIANKLDLKKNVVRVWFCNQRQKQKRMKFSSLPH